MKRIGSPTSEAIPNGKARVYLLRLCSGNESSIGERKVSHYRRDTYESEFRALKLELIKRRSASNSDLDKVFILMTHLEERESMLKLLFRQMKQIGEFHVVEIYYPIESLLEYSQERSIWLSRYFREGMKQNYAYAVGLVCEPLLFEIRQELQSACNQAYSSFMQTQSMEGYNDPTLRGVSGDFSLGYSIWYRNSGKETGFPDLVTEIDSFPGNLIEVAPQQNCIEGEIVRSISLPFNEV